MHDGCMHSFMHTYARRDESGYFVNVSCMCVPTHTHTQIHVIYTRTHACACMHAFMHIYVCTYRGASGSFINVSCYGLIGGIPGLHAGSSVRFMCVYIRMYICMCVYVCMLFLVLYTCVSCLYVQL